jgi:hypothetical protein
MPGVTLDPKPVTQFYIGVVTGKKNCGPRHFGVVSRSFSEAGLSRKRFQRLKTIVACDLTTEQLLDRKARLRNMVGSRASDTLP